MSVATYLPRRIVPGAMYEITDRTAGGQHLFSADLRPQIEASLWRAAKMADVRVFGYVFMSNHYHLLVSANGPRGCSQFLLLLHTSVAAAVNAKRTARGAVWARRADITPISAEPSAQVARLAYILANGVKEGAVAHPADWVGPHCGHDFLEPAEEPAQEAAAESGVAAAADKASKSQALEQWGTRPSARPSACLLPLPHLADLPPAAWRSDMRRLCARIASAPDDRNSWLEPHLIDPSLPRPAPPPDRAPNAAPPAPPQPQAPADPPRSTQPPARERPRDRYPVHAHDPAVRHQMRQDLESFHDAYAAASMAFRNWDTCARFPAHCIKPPQSWTLGIAAGWAALDVPVPEPATDFQPVSPPRLAA